MARKKNKRIIVKVYVNSLPVKADESPLSGILPLAKGGIFKPVNIMSGGAVLLTIASFIAHFFGKM